jgi:hypothetical protein
MKVGDKLIAINDFFMQGGSKALSKGKEYVITSLDARYFYINSDFAQYHAFPFSELINCFIIAIKSDSIIEGVIERYKERSEVGFKKYGTNMDRKDLDVQQWLSHLQEELMDATIYIQKLKEEL